jgi:uncharacterized membrane protein
MHQHDINESEWREPGNWTGRVLRRYASGRDTRLWVPKRNPALGWTLNFAHPASVPCLVAMIVVVPLVFLMVPVAILWLVHQLLP